MNYIRLMYLSSALMLLFSLGGCGNVQPPTPTTSDDHERGVEALNRGEHDLAITCFDTVIRLNPADATAYLHRGIAYFRKREYDKAIKDYSDAIRLDQDNAIPYLRRALAYDGKKDSDKAIKDYTKAIRLDPKSDKAYILRAVSYLKKRENDKAVQDCTEAIRLNPKNPSGYTTRGIGYADEGKYEKAIQDHSEAIRLNSKYFLAYNKLAWLWATCPKDKLRNGEKALEYARKACELSDWENAHNLEALAAACAENGQFDEAVKWQQKALTNQQYDKREAEEARMRLKLYEERKPYRELDRSPDSPP